MYIFSHFKIILYLFYIYFIELLEQIVYGLPTNFIGYDYTFAIGRAIYDHIDCNTLFEQNVSMADDGDDKQNDDDDEEPNRNKRKKSSKIDTSWLITTNDLNFILTITITPGTNFTFTI